MSQLLNLRDSDRIFDVGGICFAEEIGRVYRAILVPSEDEKQMSKDIDRFLMCCSGMMPGEGQ